MSLCPAIPACPKVSGIGPSRLVACVAVAGRQKPLQFHEQAVELINFGIELLKPVAQALVLPDQVVIGYAEYDESPVAMIVGSYQEDCRMRPIPGGQTAVV